MRRILALLALCITFNLSAQPPAGRTGNFTSMNAGHIYGKVVDSKTNKGIDGVSLQLIGNRFDTVNRKMTQYTLRAGLTQANGDFDFDQLPVFGNLTLKISAIGYKAVTQTISFGFGGGGRGRNGGNAQQQQSAGTADQSSAMQNMMNMIDRDLGNIKLDATEATLENVTVTSVKQLFEMGVDRKVFNVDKNIVTQGQTATEVMKQIPSLSVDIDGNVTMRNASPQLFIDGRPTTLTLDQIPADIIDRVELITNPSAKFDASGGNAGILNIVLKKNKRTGYNGGVRAGIDSRGKLNLGGDLNLRQGKINFFLNGNYSQRKSKGTTYTERYSADTTSFIQNGNSVNTGAFGFVRGGLDFLADNRNTFSLAINYMRGKFDNNDQQRIDSAKKGAAVSYTNRNTLSEGLMRNMGSQLSYKHSFPRPGHELTADITFNKSKNNNTSNIANQTYDLVKGSWYNPILQQTIGFGNTSNLIFQTDYDNPVTDKKKIEFGARAAIRDFENSSNQYFYNSASGEYELRPVISSQYKYTDKVYAAYGIYSFKIKNWSYQLGLRAESSDYNGHLAGKDSAFNVKFPISLFPSVFITKKIDDKQDIQLNYSRKINRPNFFQLMPFIDYSDPQNLNVGNAALKPEFTNSVEISYNNNYKKGANFLVSAYGKYNTDLITRYQYLGASPDKTLVPMDSVVFNTYINANKSFTYGLELTNRMPVVKNWDMTINFNLFNSKIEAVTSQGKITNQLTSWFVKLNNSIKLPKSYSIQLSGDYYAKTVLPQEGGRGGGGRGGGGMMFGGGQQSTAQGYIKPRYSFDIGIRKEWALKGGNNLSLNLSMNDFLKTQSYRTHSESPFFVQDTERRRDAQIVRLNLSWRFGKMDVNLFKRKNNRQEDTDGGGMQPM